MNFFAHYFTLIVYQPFLNVLVFFYWLTGIATHGHPDMGIAVIGLTIVIRLVLLPISLSEEQTAEQRRELAKKVEDLERTLSADPIRLRQERKKLFHRNPRFVIGEAFSLAIQVIIALMLWRMFAEGLSGDDSHLLYRFMPKVAMPFNLEFLGRFDLTHTHIAINFLQSIMIFLVETVGTLTSPYPPAKGEVVRMQLVLPTVSFLVFMGLPAGKKIFVISTLTISLLILIYKFLRRKLQDYALKLREKEAAMAAEAAAVSPGLTPHQQHPNESIIVETK